MAQDKSQSQVTDVAVESLQLSKKQRVFLIVTITLLLLSVIVLGMRISDYAQQDNREVAIDTGADVELSLFSIYYTGQNGQVVVQSSNNQKVVAPGTRFEQSILLRNADEYAIDYALEPKVTFSTRYQVPLQVRLKTAGGTYILGSAEEWASLQDLRNLDHTGTLEKTEAAEFFVEWQWPYEGNDEYDSLIGSQEREVGLEISFTFQAKANTSLDANGGWENHPDMVKNTALAIAAVIFLVCLISLIIVIRKKRKEALEGIKDPVFVPTPKKMEEVTPVMATHSISVEMLAQDFPSGSVINIHTLKQRGMVPTNAKYIHVSANPSYVLTKPLVIFANSFSPDARRIITSAGGAAIISKN